MVVAGGDRLAKLRSQMSTSRWSGGRRGSNLRSYGRDARRKIDDWTPKEVGDWLKSIGLAEHRTTFEKNQISGSELLDLGLDDLDYLKVTALAQRKKLVKAIADLAPSYEPLPPEPPKTHWSMVKPLADEQPPNPQTVVVNACDHKTLADSPGAWANPTSNGGGSLLDGTLDEDAEHDAFRKAVEAWRNASSKDTTSSKDTSSSSKKTEMMTTTSLWKKTAQDIADDLAKRLDVVHTSEIANLALRKAEAQERLDALTQSLTEAADEPETETEPQHHPRICLVSSTLGTTTTTTKTSDYRVELA